MQSQSQWYLSSLSSPLPSSAEQAYKEAIATFKLDPRKQGKLDSIKRLNSVAELETILNGIKVQYERRHDNNKIGRWLSRLSSRICHYGRIFDVLVQHHPEYVSLAWGAMKLLFVLVENHEKQVKTLAKGLALIADALPRVEFSSILYPTAQMKEATSEIYSGIVRFLLRAHDWYSQGRLRHAWEAFSRPVELYYDDLVQNIDDCAKRIDMLANAGAHAEQRDMHIKLQSLNEAVREIRGMLITHHALQTSASLDTNRRLTDLQLNQIMDFLSNANALDPLKTLEYRRFLTSRTRNFQQQITTMSKFWLDPKFSAWEAACTPTLIWLKGDYNNRIEVQSFAIEIISQLRYRKTPVLWMLKSVSAYGATAASMIDLVKGLACQALQLNVALHTESSLALTCAQFRAADTLEQWFDLLAEIIQPFSLLYIVVDIQAVGSSYSQDASWMTQLFAMFDRHSSRKWITRLKVLLVSYGVTAGESSEVIRHHDSIVLARNRPTRPVTLSHRAKPPFQTLRRKNCSMVTKDKVSAGQQQPTLGRQTAR
ncbi:nacht domain protein [Stagonosporopsis vannaccii]|nr:nacht domain protein [Stagonosporopsis vannaccii]